MAAFKIKRTTDNKSDCYTASAGRDGHLFLRTVQTAWIILTTALITGLIYVEDFWGQQLAHKTVLSVVAWLGMALALWQHLREGGVTRTMRKIAISAAALLCIGYLGSKAILEFIL